MAYKAFTTFCKGAPDTRVSGFEGANEFFNGDYVAQDDNAGTKRVWKKAHTQCFMACTGNRWEIYRVDVEANLSVMENGETVIYYRASENDTDTAFAWAAGVAGPFVYTDTSTPTEDTTICYSNPDLTANANTVTAFTDMQRTLGAKTTDLSVADDPMQGTWDLDTLYMEATPTKELLFKVPEGYEVAIVTIEIYNQSDSDGNVYLYRYDENNNEVFSFALGVKSMETVAMDHKILLPSKYSMYASSTVNGFRICINASQTLVM